MQSLYLLLAIYNKPRLAFAEVCEAIGVSKQTGYNLRVQRRFPIPMTGTPLTADVRDVAECLDRLRDEAKAHMEENDQSA